MPDGVLWLEEARRAFGQNKKEKKQPLVDKMLSSSGHMTPTIWKGL